jgi:hypothetical protein
MVAASAAVMPSEEGTHSVGTASAVVTHSMGDVPFGVTLIAACTVGIVATIATSGTAVAGTVTLRTSVGLPPITMGPTMAAGAAGSIGRR